jgi:hypothetical protein
MEANMSGRKVTREIKLPISLTIILRRIAFGLVANVLKPVLNIDKAFVAGEVHKIAICPENGSKCAIFSFESRIRSPAGRLLLLSQRLPM